MVVKHKGPRGGQQPHIYLIMWWPITPLPCSYLQEYRELGTAGGLLHFRDQIKAGEPDAFFLLHSNLCCDFPLQGTNLLFSARRIISLATPC